LKGSISRGRETIVTAAKSKASICRKKKRGILTAADEGVQSAEGERERYSCCSKPKGSICRVRETIVAATKSNGSICRGRETDILPEANPKGSICRGRNTHTHTYILAAAKQSLQSAEVLPESQLNLLHRLNNSFLQLPTLFINCTIRVICERETDIIPCSGTSSIASRHRRATGVLSRNVSVITCNPFMHAPRSPVILEYFLKYSNHTIMYLWPTDCLMQQHQCNAFT
jgi:hypothetical protein